MLAALTAAFAAAELPRLTWYQSTRHSEAERAMVDVQLQPGKVLPLRQRGG